MNQNELNELVRLWNEANEIQLLLKNQAECPFAKPIEALSEIDFAADYLEHIRQDMSDYYAEEQKNRCADRIQAEQDRKHDLRHDFFVAIFSCILTLVFEHCEDIIHFALQLLRSLL